MKRNTAIALAISAAVLLSIATFALVSTLAAQSPETSTVVQFYSPLPRSVVGVGGRFYIVAINIITTDPRLVAYPEVSINPTVRINATLAVAFTANYTARGPVDGVSIGAGSPVFGLGKNEALPGLVVIFNNTPTAMGGPGRNLANLFQFTGFQDKLDLGGRTVYRFIQTIWIVGAPAWCGWTKAIAAVISDRDGNGLLDDAPDTVPDVNGDGVIDERDLAALGVASNIATVVFYVPCPS
ncbi:MAG: hypothetical protein QXQ57_05610 [Sulfolobales archaeon]